MEVKEKLLRPKILESHTKMRQINWVILNAFTPMMDSVKGWRILFCRYIYFHIPYSGWS